MIPSSMRMNAQFSPPWRTQKCSDSQFPLDQRGNAFATHEDQNTAGVLANMVAVVVVCAQAAARNGNNHLLQFAASLPTLRLL